MLLLRIAIRVKPIVIARLDRAIQHKFSIGGLYDRHFLDSRLKGGNDVRRDF